jgi:predicted nucleic acid-binding protein
VYADTSFLVSLYVQDSFSARAQGWLTAHPVSLPLTEFGRLELRSAITRLVFTKALSQVEADAAWQAVQSDIKDGRLEPFPPSWSETFARAEELAAKYTPQVGTRTLDVLHVAVALGMGSPDFISFDLRQGELARAARLNWHFPP